MEMRFSMERPRHWRIWWQLIAVLIVGGLVLAACGDDTTDEPAGDDAADNGADGEADDGEASGDPITIGLVTDLSGRFVTFGRDINVATELAVEQVNADGGINGSPIELVVEDTAGEPEQAVTAIRDLVRRDVFAISGPLSSGEAEVAFAQAPQLEIVLITGTANAEGLGELGQGWALRNTATNTALYETAMPVWADEYGIESAVLVYDEAEPVSSAAATGAIPAVGEDLEIDVVNADSPITFSRGQTDFSTVIQRVRETDADGVIVMSAPEEAGLVARELARQGEERPVLGHPAQGTPAFFERGGEAINDWVLPLIFNRTDPDEQTQRYIDEMDERDPEPPTVAEAGNYYDNIMMLTEVMRDAGIDADTPVDEAREAIRDGLLAISEYSGVTGTITFDGDPDAQKTVWVHVVRAGELELLEAVE
jgi:branched-chain amino acid transport system substrate-binding protein